MAKKAARKAAGRDRTREAKRTPRRARRLPEPEAIARPWLASYPPGVPERYEYPLVPLTRLLDDAAKDFPHGTALQFVGREITYRELVDQVDRLATALQHLGVGKGDRVGVILPNCPQHVVSIFAALRLGAVVVECNPLHTEARLEAELNDAGCRVLVCLDPVYPRLAALKGRLRSVEHIIATSLADALPLAKAALFPLRHRNDPTMHHEIADEEGVLRYAHLVRRTAPAVAQAQLDPREDVAFLLYTAGTTGPSKGVMLTHLNLVANAFQSRLWVPDVQAGRENVLCVMPLSHAFGLTTCLLFGVLSAGTLILVPRFEANDALKIIEKRKPTLLPGIPAVFQALNEAAQDGKRDLSSIRVALCGAGSLPAATAGRFEELTGAKLRVGYGLTEAGPLTHANPVYGKAKPDAVGLPVTDTVCTLVDPDDPTRPAPPGGPGELAISGPQVMRGYWNRPTETAAVLRDGWLLTGDIANVDDDGYFTIISRKGAAGAVGDA